MGEVHTTVIFSLFCLLLTLSSPPWWPSVPGPTLLMLHYLLYQFLNLIVKQLFTFLIISAVFSNILNGSKLVLRS